MAALPFILFLLSLVIVPKRYETLSCIIFGGLGCLVASSLSQVTHTLLHEYLPFISLIANLYIIASRVTLSISFKASSFNLMFFLGIGALISNFLGTTGASILLIYPLLKLLKQKQYKTHVILFFIFLVSNCGGCLTPLGDPPLFMGYLKGVPFFWPLINLWKIYIFIIGSLLGIFYCIDAFYYKEALSKTTRAFRFQGAHYLFLLMIVIVASFLQNIFVQLSILGALLVWYYKDMDLSPVYEIAKIFLVIFITLIPLESSLLIPSILTPFQIFWICGGLSAFLDNAPTYLLFFPLTQNNMIVLKAISISSVCMGALTYIGNAPNLMIKTIAELEGITMPSFIWYTIYASIALVPALLIAAVIWLK